MHQLLSTSCNSGGCISDETKCILSCRESMLNFTVMHIELLCCFNCTTLYCTRVKKKTSNVHRCSISYFFRAELSSKLDGFAWVMTVSRLRPFCQSITAKLEPLGFRISVPRGFQNIVIFTASIFLRRVDKG